MTLTQITEKGIKDGEIVNADINASAAIAGSKISPDFGSQAITTTNNLTCANQLTIGGTEPRLVFTDGDNNPDFTLWANGGNFKIYDTTNSTSRFNVINSGKIGINTESPTGQLTVHNSDDANINVFEVYNDNGNMSGGFSQNSAGDGTISAKKNDGTLSVLFRSNGDSYLNGGNVGIGTTSPDAPLTIHNSSDPEIRFGYSSTQDHALNWDSSKVYLKADPENANNNSAIGFDVDGSTKLYIDDSGRVGIGTTSPTTLLNLSDTNPLLRLTGTNAGNVDIQTDSADFLLNCDSSNAKDNSAIAFRVDNSEKMRIDSSGVLGIGVVPQTGQYSGYDHLQVGESATLSSNDTQGDTNVTNVAQNVYLNANASAWKYLHTDEATLYQSHSGNHHFYTAPSGSQDNTVTFTERLCISPDGIKFNGDTSASNALDDYEEGTFTPTATFESSDDGNKTYSSQGGTYTKIGRMVRCNIVLAFSNKGTGSGRLRFNGLPFTVGDTLSGTVLEGAAIVGYFAGLSSSVSDIKPMANQGSDQIVFYGVLGTHATGAGDFTYAHLGHAFSIRMSLTYFV